MNTIHFIILVSFITFVRISYISNDWKGYEIFDKWILDSVLYLQKLCELIKLGIGGFQLPPGFAAGLNNLPTH